MLAWLRRLFAADDRREKAAAAQAAPPEATPAPAADDAPAPPATPAAPAAATVRTAELAHGEAVALGRIEEKIAAGKLEMPSLSPSAVQVLAMVGDRDVEVADLVAAIAADPVLSSELLKVANSALFGSEQVETIGTAITRIGLRRLRGMVYATSMRSLILGFETLSEHAAEVWRQAQSSAAIAHAIAPRLGIEPDKAFMIGLLHDVGRIPLLALLNREGKTLGTITENMVGRVFNRYHERAGETVARLWKLSDELVAVAGCHHMYERNTEHGRSAALASLAHRLDLMLAAGAHGAELAQCPELDFLAIGDEDRAALLATAEEIRTECARGESIPA